MSRSPARRHQEGIAYTLRQREKKHIQNSELKNYQNYYPDNQEEEEESYFGFLCGSVAGAVIGTVAGGLPGLFIGAIVLGNIAHLIDD